MKAWEMLSKDGAWIQGNLARGPHGKVTFALDADAVSFCVLGAIEKCYGYSQESANCQKRLGWRIYEKYGRSIPWWNDHPSTTREDVVAVLKTLDI